MKWEIYSWDCWHDRPHLKLFGKETDFSSLPLKKRIIGSLLMVGINIFSIILYILYWISLPFAFINEWVRSW